MLGQNTVSQERYQKNLKFWEDAWSRVKQASTKIPDVLEYIPEIPAVFKGHNCSRILDIACGSGWLSFYLAEHDFEIVGIDISESGIRLANEVLQDEKKALQNKVNFVCADMFAMNFPENFFDGILINAAFEHLDFERGKEFLSKIKYYLKPNAVMYGVFDKVATGTKGEFEVLEDGTHQYFDQMRDGMFLRNYSDEELNVLFTLTKWQLESIKKNSFESRIVVALNKK
jgi:2-polyprenyl-3-methyl-5-hydroxy-6-metoxy-1,4-benzoquinol methylase